MQARTVPTRAMIMVTAMDHLMAMNILAEVTISMYHPTVAAIMATTNEAGAGADTGIMNRLMLL